MKQKKPLDFFNVLAQEYEKLNTFERIHTRTKITASGKPATRRENTDLILVKTKGNDSILKDSQWRMAGPLLTEICFSPHYLNLTSCPLLSKYSHIHPGDTEIIARGCCNHIKVTLIVYLIKGATLAT